MKMPLIKHSKIARRAMKPEVPLDGDPRSGIQFPASRGQNPEPCSMSWSCVVSGEEVVLLLACPGKGRAARCGSHRPEDASRHAGRPTRLAVSRAAGLPHSGTRERACRGRGCSCGADRGRPSQCSAACPAVEGPGGNSPVHRGPPGQGTLNRPGVGMALGSISFSYGA